MVFVFSGSAVVAAGLSNIATADPQVRRVERRGNVPEETVAWEAQESVPGGWGLGLPGVRIGPRGCPSRRTITRFPAPGPSRASRIWESGNSGSLASRNFAPEHHSEPQHELRRTSHSRFRGATALSQASEKASPKTDPEGDLCTEPGASEGLSTASGASPGTCRLRLFFGVGGSGRSPLECPTCEISAGARAREETLLALERARYTLWR